MDFANLLIKLEYGIQEFTNFLKTIFVYIPMGSQFLNNFLNHAPNILVTLLMGIFVGRFMGQFLKLWRN